MKTRLVALALLLGWNTLAMADSALLSKDIKSENSSSKLLPLFKCGPGFSTYSVKALDGRKGDGVRCVKLSDPKVIKDHGNKLTGVYWYGEGQWNGATYRHIGLAYSYAIHVPQYPAYTAYAADISGNGEEADNEFHDLSVTAVNGDMKQIQVTGGGWNEEWNMESSGEAKTYRSTLKPVTNCGSHLRKAVVAAANGEGVRCLINPSKKPASGPPPLSIVWYGEGKWDGRQYRHLGFTGNKCAPSAAATAADICSDPASFCGQTKEHGLTVEEQQTAEGDKCQTKYVVSGDWNEVWNGAWDTCN